MTAAAHRAALHVPAPEKQQMRALGSVVKRVRADQHRTPLTWGVPLGLMCGMMVAIYPSIEESLQRAIDAYPAGVKQAFRIEDLDSAAAYLDTEMFSLVVPIALAVFAIRCVNRALSGAEEARFLDVVLSAPVRRWTLLAGAVLATAVSAAAVLVATGALAWVGSVASGAGVSTSSLVAGIASVWPLAVFSAGLAALLCGLTGRSALVTGVGSGIVVAMYVVDLVGKLAESLDWIRYGSVFRYYGSALRDGLDPAAFIGVTIVGAVLAVVGALLFERRDVSA